MDYDSPRSPASARGILSPTRRPERSSPGPCSPAPCRHLENKTTETARQTTLTRLAGRKKKARLSPAIGVARTSVAVLLEAPALIERGHRPLPRHGAPTSPEEQHCRQAQRQHAHDLDLDQLHKHPRAPSTGGCLLGGVHPRPACACLPDVLYSSTGSYLPGILYEQLILMRFHTTNYLPVLYCTSMHPALKIASGIRRSKRRPGNFRTDAREATEFCECTRDERAALIRTHCMKMRPQSGPPGFGMRYLSLWRTDICKRSGEHGLSTRY